MRVRDVVQKTCLRRWTIGKSGERGSGISVLPARHDDDDDNQKLLYLLGENNTYKHMYLQTVLKNINDLNKSYRKLISNDKWNIEKSWSLLINYHPIIPKIYALSKPPKPDVPLRPIIFGIESAPHNIARLLAKLISPLLSTIRDAYIKNSVSLLNQLTEIDMNNK